jgi:hypothetical protein
MTGPVLRAGAWPAVAGVSGVAVVVGGCGAAFPAAAAALLPICFALLAAAAAFTLDEPVSRERLSFGHIVRPPATTA